MVRPIDKTPIHLPVKEAAVRDGHEVSVEVDNTAPIVGDPQGISGQKSKPHLIHLLIIFIIMTVTY
jgi:hypothetical protein